MNLVRSVLFGFSLLAATYSYAGGSQSCTLRGNADKVAPTHKTQTDHVSTNRSDLLLERGKIQVGGGASDGSNEAEAAEPEVLPNCIDIRSGRAALSAAGRCEYPQFQHAFRRNRKVTRCKMMEGPSIIYEVISKFAYFRSEGCQRILDFILENDPEVKHLGPDGWSNAADLAVSLQCWPCLESILKRAPGLMIPKRARRAPLLEARTAFSEAQFKRILTLMPEALKGDIHRMLNDPSERSPNVRDTASVSQQQAVQGGSFKIRLTTQPLDSRKIEVSTSTYERPEFEYKDDNTVEIKSPKPVTYYVSYVDAESASYQRSTFKVGQMNSTEAIRRAASIAGVSIRSLEAFMRPDCNGSLHSGMAHHYVGSMAGFLNDGDSLVDVLVKDNQYVVDQLNLTHQDLADKLISAIRNCNSNLSSCVNSSLHRYRMQETTCEGGNFQWSPFQDGERSCTDYTFTREDGRELKISELLISFIRQYGFYEGNIEYRVPPQDIVEFFDIRK